MNCDENYQSQQSSSIYTPSYHRIQAPKSLAQERLKSNLELRNQIIVSSIKYRKVFAKFMIPIALFKKFLSQQFIASVEVSNIARYSSRINELRDIDSIGCRTRNITIQKWEIDHFKIESRKNQAS